jgi:uncharacterized membrane protein
MANQPSFRLGYIDWLRGLACLLMFQTHCYDAWLMPVARNSTFGMWSQLGGTFPAPLFLFLAGVSLAITFERRLEKGLAAGEIAKATVLRGAQLFGLALLFRVQEFALSFRYAPWSDLLRVDILNTIAVSIILIGVFFWLVMGGKRRERMRFELAASAAFVVAAIVLLTPLLWTRWRPSFLPWPIESYINGVHNLGEPQAWLFPIFPWTAFAFAGLTFGCLWKSDNGQRSHVFALLVLGGTGLLVVYAGKFFDALRFQIYPVYDFWHTSPNFFLIRLGLLLLIVTLAYVWCRWGLGQWGFSPVIQLGNTSLLVYWVHIEFVYGRFRILPHHSQTVAGASRGLLTIILAMLALSLARTNWKRFNWHRPTCERRSRIATGRA